MAYMLRLKYHANYDYSSAKLDEWYTLWKLVGKKWYRRNGWKPVMTGCGEYRFPVRGDYDWAVRIARDNKIPIPLATHPLTQIKQPHP